MAQVNIQFNTVEKTLAVSIDGKPMENVVEVCAMAYGDKFGLDILSRSHDEENKVVKFTKIVASQSDAAAALLADGGRPSEEFAGFVVEAPQGVNADVKKYWGQK